MCSQLRESSEQPQLWHHFVFKVNFEVGLLPPKRFQSVTSLGKSHLEICSSMKCGTFIRRLSFKVDVLNIFGNSKKSISDRADIHHSYELLISSLS